MERSTIQVLHKRGKSIRQIAEALGRSPTTVSRVLREPVDQPPARRARRSHVDPYREQIAQWVADGLTAVRMLELARADPAQPYPGQHAVFRAAVREERLRQHQAGAVHAVPVRFEGLPAEYLQVDWGEIRHCPFTQVTAGMHRTTGTPWPETVPGVAGGRGRSGRGGGGGGKGSSAARYFLACRLKYSRWMWVRFTTDMRQETLFRGLLDCFYALGFVPWVLVFDNMRTVTWGRDAQRQPLWNPALLQLAATCGFHPEACTPGAANQKGSVESLVGFVKGNFLAGRDFADDADLGVQCTDWLDTVNERPSRATDVPPVVRLPEEVAKGGPVPAHAQDYGFAHAARVSAEALVAVLGNQYSVPIVHTGAPVTARVHRARIVIWRDAAVLAEHPRSPDGAHRRVVEPAHYALLFATKPRAQVMLYREALLALGPVASHYVAEVSFRRRAQLRQEILGIHGLYETHGKEPLLAAMSSAATQGAYGASSLRALVEGGRRDGQDVGGSGGGGGGDGVSPLTRATPGDPSLPAASATARDLATLATLVTLAGLPAQTDVDRHLSAYECYVLAEHAPSPAPAVLTVSTVLAEAAS